MKELLRTNDAVLINYAQSLLRQAGIGCLLADQYISVAEGSIDAFPRRLLVGNEDWTAARLTLEEAGLAEHLIKDGDARA